MKQAPSTHFHESFETVLKVVQSQKASPLLPGPPGCGKSTIAEQVAARMNLDYSYASALESSFQLKGFTDAYGRVVRTDFCDRYENGGLYFFDEIDASDPTTLISIHTALSNNILDTPGGKIERHPDFYFMAAANTFGNGQEMVCIGRNRLDAASLDRFFFLPISYDPVLERDIVLEQFPRQNPWLGIVHAARQAADELVMPRAVITMRACLEGAALREQGLDAETVFRGKIVKDMPPADGVKLWNKTGEILERDLGPLTTPLQKKYKDVEGINNAAEIYGNLSAAIDRARSLEKDLRDAQRALEQTKTEICGILEQGNDRLSVRESLISQYINLKFRLRGSKL